MAAAVAHFLNNIAIGSNRLDHVMRKLMPQVFFSVDGGLANVAGRHGGQLFQFADLAGQVFDLLVLSDVLEPPLF